MSCGFESNGQSTPALPPLIQQNDIVASFLMANQGSINLTTGTHTIVSEEGPSMVIDAFQQGTTFDIDAASGRLRFRASVGNTQFSTAAATAARVQFPWGRFFRAFDCDATRDYTIEVYCTLMTLPTAQASPAGFQLGILRNVNTPSGGAASYKAIKRNNAAGAQALNCVVDAAGVSDSYTNPLPNVAWVDPAVAAPAGGEIAGNTMCFALQCGDAALQMLAGNYNPATMVWSDVLFMRNIDALTAISTTGLVFKDQQNIPTIAFATGNANADMQVDVEAIVIRSPR